MGWKRKTWGWGVKTKCLDNTLKTWWQHRRWSNSHELSICACAMCIVNMTFDKVFIIQNAILFFLYQVFQGTEERPSKWHLFIVFQNWPALFSRLVNKFYSVHIIPLSFIWFNKKQLKLNSEINEIQFVVVPKIILFSEINLVTLKYLAHSR